MNLGQASISTGGWIQMIRRSVCIAPTTVKEVSGHCCGVRRRRLSWRGGDGRSCRVQVGVVERLSSGYGELLKSSGLVVRP